MTNKEREKNMKLDDLIKIGVLRFARKPANNPDNLDFTGYTVSLIEHDYPAKTPVMWNAAYKALGMSVGNLMLVGVPSQIKEIFKAFRKDPEYLGGGAGVGFKDEAVGELDEIDPLAKQIGAVNFIAKNADGKLRGYNTDGRGYAQSLEEIFKTKEKSLEGKKAVILGAGGTGNAIAFSLAEKGMKIIILNRTVEKAEALANRINRFFALTEENIARFGGEDQITEEVSDADAVVNVSTKGAAGDFENYSALAPAKLPVSKEGVRQNIEQANQVLTRIPKTAVISDIVLKNEPTLFLKAASDAGFKTLDGIPMVVNQGAEAFWLIHGNEALKRGFTKKYIQEVMEKAAFA